MVERSSKLRPGYDGMDVHVHINCQSGVEEKCRVAGNLDVSAGHDPRRGIAACRTEENAFKYHVHNIVEIGNCHILGVKNLKPLN